MDMGASVIARLKNKSKATGKPLQLYLQLLCQEEFLRRVSMSDFADNLILKGGLFIYMLTNFESRSTIDVDFLMRRLPNSLQQIQGIIDRILAVDTGNNFIAFETKGYENIALQHKYNGVSFKLIGRIKNTRTPFKVDICVGDVIVPKAEKRTIPVQLTGFIAPKINTYSLESTVAEKLDAILQRMELTSRMKDFYDIYFLASTFDFDGRKLQEAIFQTLQNRGTNYGKDSIKTIVSLGKNDDMQDKWQQFLKRLKLPGLTLTEVLRIVDELLSPIWIAVTDETEFFGRWSAAKLMWR